MFFGLDSGYRPEPGFNPPVWPSRPSVASIKSTLNLPLDGCLPKSTPKARKSTVDYPFPEPLYRGAKRGPGGMPGRLHPWPGRTSNRAVSIPDRETMRLLKGWLSQTEPAMAVTPGGTVKTRSRLGTDLFSSKSRHGWQTDDSGPRSHFTARPGWAPLPTPRLYPVVHRKISWS